MGIWDKLKGEFIDIIDWTDDTQDTIVYRFERHNNEIKYEAKLTVRESQAAVFVNEGQIADVYEPGMHTLITQNMPILSTLKGWKYGFNSPFKAEVYFVNTKRFTGMKWGTANPIMMRDPDFGVVRVRAFGNYAFRVVDPGKFLKEIAGTDWQFPTEEVNEHLRNQIVSKFPEAVSTAGIPLLDLASKYTELGQNILATLKEGMAEIGVELINFNVENVSVPPEVEEAIDKRSSMGVVGNLGAYTQFQAANALEKAAEAGGPAAMGIGMMIPGMVQQGMQQPAAAPAPPPVPAGVTYHVAIDGAQQGPYDLATLKSMAGNGTLTKETLVWTAGMANWTPAGQVPDLSAVFGAVPPPLPPQ